MSRHADFACQGSTTTPKSRTLGIEGRGRSPKKRSRSPAGGSKRLGSRAPWPVFVEAHGTFFLGSRCALSSAGAYGRRGLTLFRAGRTPKPTRERRAALSQRLAVVSAARERCVSTRRFCLPRTCNNAKIEGCGIEKGRDCASPIPGADLRLGPAAAWSISAESHGTFFLAHDAQ